MNSIPGLEVNELKSEIEKETVDKPNLEVPVVNQTEPLPAPPLQPAPVYEEENVSIDVPDTVCSMFFFIL